MIIWTKLERLTFNKCELTRYNVNTTFTVIPVYGNLMIVLGYKKLEVTINSEEKFC